jgi:predicted nucleotidyltransferase
MLTLNNYSDQIKKACKQHQVDQIYVFGSYARNEEDESSDIDLLVKFQKVDPYEYFDNYMDFKFKMENLFDRPVDLLEIQTLKNPVLKKVINRERILLYGRESPQKVI